MFLFQYTPDVFSDAYPDENLSIINTKRKRIASEELLHDEQSANYELVRPEWLCCKCKADALLKLGQNQKALECIDR